MASHDFRNKHRGVRFDGRTLNFTGQDAIADHIVRVEQAGEGFRTPLLRAAAAGQLGFAMAVNGEPVLARILKRHSPTVVLLADDQPGATGPDGWRQARKLMRWAHSAVFHAAGGEAAHYQLFAEAALTCRRLLVVEMQIRHMPAWARLVERELPRLNLLRIVPQEGQHPIQGAPTGAVVH